MALLDRIMSRVWPGYAVTRAALDPTAGYTAHVMPRPRSTFGVDVHDAVTIPAVYRAIQVLTTSAAQLTLDVERNGVRVGKPAAIVRRPSLEVSRSDFIEQTVLSLAVDGNAFWHKRYAGSELVALDVLNPHHVTVTRDPKTDRVEYAYRGKALADNEIEHIHLFRLPGRLRGLGPIQAAQTKLRGALDMGEHMGRWFSDTGQPTGVLSSDQELTAEYARAYRNAWNGLDEAGDPIPTTENPSGIKVLGKGLTYEPILLKPKDAMWLDAQAFTTLEVARLFGTPTSLMYAAIEGNSQTYSNVEQEWLAFVRFTLMSYLRKIEEAFTALTPAGQTVRFRLETLLRSDTKTRYDSYSVALSAGWMTRDEVRDTEGLPPLTDAQRADIAAAQPAPATDTAPEGTNV